jgi:hypothetical protein
MKLLTSKLGLFILLTWIIITSYDSEDENQLSIMGTAHYIETSLVADEIPIKLTIFDLDNPFRANPSNVVYTDEIVTDKEGKYKFSFNRGLLPKNASYMLSITTESLVITGEITPCFQSGSAGGGFSTSNEIIRDLKIDYPTYLQITLDKLNDMTSDRVILSRPSCSLAVFESTLDRPDTTILEKMHYYNFKKVDIKYYILNENEETIEYMISDVHLVKNDTTKLTIEY